jgi:hypothetical protein
MQVLVFIRRSLRAFVQQIHSMEAGNAQLLPPSERHDRISLLKARQSRKASQFYRGTLNRTLHMNQWPWITKIRGQRGGS